MAALDNTRLKARADKFNASQPSRSTSAYPSIAEWHEPIRFLKTKRLSRANQRRLRELRSAPPNWEDLKQLRLPALKYGANGHGLGWI